MTYLRGLANVLFVLAVPVLLISVAVTWAFNDLRLYRHGFDTYDVATVTGISDADLTRVARELRSYFNSGREPLSIRASVYGVERELFNEREVLHMRDVKHLVWGVYGALGVAALYVLAYAGVGLGAARGAFLRPLTGRLLWGSALTVALVALVGLAGLVSFDATFLLFHRLSFANDLWQLTCPIDYLVCLFPQGFWADATFFVGLASAGMAVVVGGASVVALRLLPRSAKARTRRWLRDWQARRIEGRRVRR